MNDFEGLLSTNYGFKSSNQCTPMAPSKSSDSSSSSFSSFIFRDFVPNSTSNSSNFNNNYRKSGNYRSYSSNLGEFDEISLNSRVKSGNDRKSDGNLSNAVNFESIFGGGGGGGGETVSSPVFDKPVYDDEVVSNSYDDVFASTKSGGGGGGGGGDALDDLLGGLGKKEEPLLSKSTSNFDDLLPGFGGISSMNRSSSDATRKSSSVLDDPFVVLESTSHHRSSSSRGYRDPLEEVGLNNSGSKSFGNSSNGGVFDDVGNFNNLGSQTFSTEMRGREKDESPLRTGSRVSGRRTSVGAEGGQKSSLTSPDRGSDRKIPVDDFGESPQSVFEMPSASAYSSKSVPTVSSPVYKNSGFRESNSSSHVSPPSEQNMGSFDKVWLTVSEIPLFTQPTAAPPSRPPPPRPRRFSRAESGSYPASNAQRKVNEHSSVHGFNQYFDTPKSAPAGTTKSFASSLDELEEFAAGRNQSKLNENSEVCSTEEFDTDSAAAASAAAMKEAMDRAEAKFRYAKGVRERESPKVFRSTATVENVEKANAQDREFGDVQERQQREKEEVNRRQKEEEDRRRSENEREEKEKEKRRVERERELARLAVERATREARERAAIEARTKVERAAVQKANLEARERAERAAVQRAQAEARERAAAIAKERAEKAAAEEREKARSEAREKEAREKAAAATASKAASQQNEPDFESIFGVGSRASSAPGPRTTSSSKPAPEATRTSVNSASSMRKASSSASIVDDLTSIFGEKAPSSSGDFQDVDGETDERRRARLERHQRTQERAAKALAEKNARDLEAQREQAERHRISETLDVEIKRWAAGKEGNLRALLSTLQYVLWPECGWQPVSLTDLITGASVKKAYRKATLCIHPDKVQQKGANLQQKYVAEKVFDMLKEAWNKFNSEELF